MGYYTRFSLEIVSGNDWLTNYEKEITKSSSYGSDDDEEDYSIFGDEIKWYEHEADMRKFSTKYPDVIFKLIGIGEEDGDMWHEYYKNGKMQRVKAEIVFKPFDATQLK